MATIDLSCKLLCASASAYLIQTNYPSGMYQLNLIDPSTTTIPATILRKTHTPNAINQYKSIGLVSDPYAIVSDDKIDACFVGKTNTEIIVAFRGTLPPALDFYSILDWIQNIADADPVAHDDLPGMVHGGFLKAVMHLIDNVNKAIGLLDPNHSLPLYITGHSKGGGMSSIAAMYLKNKYNLNITQTITIAGPKPGNGTFRDAYNTAFKNDLNYENYLDIVPFLAPSDLTIDLIKLIPHLPPKFKKYLERASHWDYENVGQVKYINEYGNLSTPPSDFHRLLKIAETLPLHPSLIGDAHHVSCGYRYIKGICQGAVCKF